MGFKLEEKNIHIKKKDLDVLKKEFEKYDIKVEYSNGDLKLDSEDYYSMHKASKVLESIKAGFEVKDSVNLMDENYAIVKIDIRDFAGKNVNHITRLKSRVIGRKGRAKGYIEEITGTKIRIKDHDIYILGEVDNVELAKDTVVKLLKGSPHSNVYRWMEGRKKDLKKRKIYEENVLLKENL